MGWQKKGMTVLKENIAEAVFHITEIIAIIG